MNLLPGRIPFFQSRVLFALWLYILLFSIPSPIFALPVGEQVTQGRAHFAREANVLNIQQSTPKAVIQWEAFNIGAAEAVNFQQPSATAMALNRILSATGTEIYGRLSSNGQLFLINPNGILFGPHAQVNAGSLVASSLNIRDEDFLSGHYLFSDNGSGKGVTNAGNIGVSAGGYAALIGAQVKNEGTIASGEGASLALAAGGQVEIRLEGSRLLGLRIEKGTVEALVKNGGLLKSPAGRILMTAKGLNGVSKAVVNNTGIVEATRLVGRGGKIFLSGDQVEQSGQLLATGKESAGGKITVVGDQIRLSESAVVDASGDTGGGNIRIGGDAHGEGRLQRATEVNMAEGAKILADANEQGDGGEIVLWSDQKTTVKGQISARGGKTSGNGGWIETSSHGYLDVNGMTVDTLAPHGKTGSWLLDPNNLTIQTAGSNTGVTGNPNFTMTGFVASILTIATLQTALGSSNASVTTGGGTQAGGLGTITLANALTWSSANALTLTSVNKIFINAAITATNGSLNLSAQNVAQSITSGTTALPSATGVTANISVRNFNLTQGQWFQLNASLPIFSVSNNFQLASGAAAPTNLQFVRAQGGTGAVGNPYQLVDIYGLQGINSSATTLANSYILQSNIDASTTVTWNGGAGFVPIGTAPASPPTTAPASAYSGTFNGNNFTINNLYINRPSTNQVGLFGVNGGTVQNVGLVSDTVTGDTYIGGLIGINYGTVNTVYTTGSVSNSSGSDVGGLIGFGVRGNISNSYNTGSVTGFGGTNVGGLVGNMVTGSMTGCYNTGTVGGNNPGTGGLVGTTAFSGFLVGTVTISNSFNTGAVSSTGIIGGLVGVSNYTGGSVVNISNSYNTGPVTATTYYATGGIVGNSYNNSTMSNVYNTGTVTGSSAGSIGGVIGYNQGMNISTSYSTGQVFGASGSPDVGGFVGQNISGTITDSYSLGPVVTGTTLGGFAGSNSGTLNRVYSAGFVSGTSPVGGLVGSNTGGTVTNSFWDTQTSGQATSDAGTGRTTAQMMTQSTFTGVGWNFATTWGIITGANPSYPYLRVFYPTTPRALSGLSPAAGDKTAQLAVNGALFDITYTGANGFYYFLEGNNVIGVNPINKTIADNTAFLVYLNNAGVKGNAVGLTAASGGSVTGLDMTADTIRLGGNTTASVNITNMSTAAGSLPSTDILYSVSGGGNLTLGNATNTTANLNSSSTTTMTFGGTVAPITGGSGTITMGGPTVMSDTSITTNGAQTYNTVSVGSSTTVTGTNNAIAFNSTINSLTATPQSLTVTAGSGAMTFNGVIGGVNPLNNFTASTTGTATVTLPSTTATGNILVTSTNASSGIIIAPAAVIQSTAASGTTITLVGHTFTNNSNASALNPGGGNFQVWSTSPALDTHNGLTSNFIQYGATYPSTPVLGTGNGFLYSVSPVITPILTGSVTKQYNGTTAATLTAGNYSSSGALGGDTVTLNNPTSGIYDTRNVGTGKTVSVTGINIASATNGSATVFGYTLSSTSANAAIGTITAAPLTVSSNTGQSKVYGTNDPNSAKTAYSATSGTLFAPDTLTGNMGRVAGENVGSYNFTQNTVAVSDGNGGNNYTLTFNGTTNPFQITKAALTASILSQSKIYGTNDPALSGIAVTLGGVINASVTNINGATTPINDTGNVATTLASLTRTAGELVSGSPYTITASTFNALTGSAAGNYTTPAGLSGLSTLTITRKALTSSIANQSKVYGTNDPALPGIAVNLGGIVNTSVTNWNGTVTAINDTGNVATTLASLTRAAGELVSGSPYTITAATLNALTGSAIGNYTAPLSLTGSPVLTITPVALTAAIADQTKAYGTDDPALPGIFVNLSGLVNTSVTNWNGAVTPINDTGNVSATLASLTRVSGELVSGSPYSITGGTFNALTGSAIGNYTAPTNLTGSPTLAITRAPLTAAIANQSKIYGTNDPLISGIAVNLSGVVNTSVTNWNGAVTSINDTGNVVSTLASLSRSSGELVSGSPYAITAATFNALTGSAAGNYTALLSLTGSPTLSITRVPLTASIANQSKVYGTNDPLISGISVNLSGIVNASVTNWNGVVTAINDTGNVATSLASLTRATGESVSGSPYAITAATFNALTGSAINNYTAPSILTGGPTLSITPVALTASIANQSKLYGTNDPALPGISVNLSGLVNTSVTNWNGAVTPINDTGNVAATLASLSRTAGELVSGSPYAITAATFNALTGSAALNYTGPLSLTGSPVLTITPVALTASVADQTKNYGTDDPAISGILVTLGGIINASVTNWNGTVTPINDTGNVATTLAGLTRDSGELVSGSPYAITAGIFNALTGSAALNYVAPSVLLSGSTLTIDPVPLTASIADQMKDYGTDDPSLSGIGVNIAGTINTSVTDWNGVVTAINDTGNVATTLASLTRDSGELVSSSPYAITGGTFNALTGSAAGNYTAPTFVSGNSILTINPVPLTASIADQSKDYGTDDPALSGIGVTLAGVVNVSVTDWNGTVTPINDTGNVATTLASLSRDSGEVVDDSPYAILDGTFNALTGSAVDNYIAPMVLSGIPILTINPVPLTASIADQSKDYGTDDPALSGIGVTLGGIVNTSVTDWNGDVTTINDTGNVETTLAGLVRDPGELVNGSPYAIIDATYNSLTGSAVNNYTAPVGLSGAPLLTITPVALTASIADQTKDYGTDDPALSAIGVILGDVVNTDVTDWNGTVTHINDTGNVAATLASLTRDPGELVSGSPYAIMSGTFNALTGSAADNYTTPLGLTGSPTLTITPVALTASIGNQTKSYGTDDPALSGITVNLGGVINTSVTDWNGVVTAINDTGNVATTLASLTRVSGELVSGSPYAITSGTFNPLTGSAAGNYTSPLGLTGSPTLTITPVALTASIGNQTKSYGTDDPALSGITVNLGGVINTSVTDWNGVVTAINDTGNVATTLASLTRVSGELVSGSPYAITSGTFNPLTGSAAGNYTSPLGLTGSPTLTITPVALTASIGNQTKSYGTDDPALSGITVNLGGVINTSVTDWNGVVTAINDTGNVATTLASLTRVSGELVSGSPYAITSGTFNPLTGSAAGNYTSPLGLTGSPILTITPVALTASIANQTKSYGTNDPALSGISVNLGGVVNAIVTDWNGAVTTINDTGNVATTLASLARVSGELVSGSPYAITSGTFNPLTGSAADNYTAPLGLTGNPILTITPVALTASIANQTKPYGTNDPALSGITVNLAGIINTSVTDWNGAVTAINDTGNVATTLASLSRVSGEQVATSPYAITGALFNALTGSASGNYTVPSALMGSPVLAITPIGGLTATLSNQTKTYGQNDPPLPGIGVTLSGMLNTSVTDWNGSTSVINDTMPGAVTASLASLARTSGETVVGSPYAITAASFNPLGGVSGGSYLPPAFTGTPNLTITPAGLTVAANSEGKLVGTPDPPLTYTTIGLVNGVVTDWNGTMTVINDTPATVLTGSLTRVPGETTGLYPILQGSLALTSNNYNLTYVPGIFTITAVAPLPPFPPVEVILSYYFIPPYYYGYLDTFFNLELDNWNNAYDGVYNRYHAIARIYIRNRGVKMPVLLSISRFRI